MFPQNSYTETQSPVCWYLEVIRSWGWSPHQGISILYFILFLFLFLCWLEIHCGIYKSSYNISNISQFGSPLLFFYFIPSPHPTAISSWGWTLHEGISVHLKETIKLPPSFYHMKTQRKDSYVWIRKWVLTSSSLCWYPDLGLLASRIMGSKQLSFLVFFKNIVNWLRPWELIVLPSLPVDFIETKIHSLLIVVREFLVINLFWEDY
jgi:hypothetical protein